MSKTDPPPEDHDSDEEIPKLPRAPLFRGLRRMDVIRIITLGVMMVAVIVLAKPCSQGVARFVESFEPDIDAAVNPLEGYDLIPAEEALRLYYADAGTGSSGDGGATTADAGP